MCQNLGNGGSIYDDVWFLDKWYDTSAQPQLAVDIPEVPEVVVVELSEVATAADDESVEETGVGVEGKKPARPKRQAKTPARFQDHVSR